MAYVNAGVNVTKDSYIKVLKQTNKDEKVINEIITDGERNNKFNNLLGSRFYSIMVVGIADANYSITVRPVEHFEKKLLYGVLDFTSLRPKEVRNYTFLFTKSDVYVGKKH